MTILLHDAKANLEDKTVLLETNQIIHELLYADDTLLVEANAHNIEEYMRSIEACGKHYGLEFNIKKLEGLPINCEPEIKDSDGNPIKMKEAITYLGAMLTSDGKVHGELSKRLGATQTDFTALSKVWNHTNLSRREKMHLFNALVVPKLMYVLETTWLNATERR